jgi:hypothetical protein
VRKIRTAATVAALKRLAAQTTTTVRKWIAQTDDLDAELASLIDPSADVYYRALPRRKD